MQIDRSELAPRDRVEVLASELADAADNFVDAVHHWLPQWWNRAVLESVDRDPQRVIDRVGSGGMGALKSRFADLVERGPGLIAAELDDDSLWLHRLSVDVLLSARPDSVHPWLDRYRLGRRSPQNPDSVAERLRRLAGWVGPLLVDAELADWYVDSRFRQAGQRVGPWVRPEGGSPPRYVPGMTYPASLTSPMEVYEDLVIDLYAELTAHVTGMLDEAREDARRLWYEA